MRRAPVATFAAMAIGVLLITIDISSINLALNAIEKQFQFGLGTAQWVVAAYMVAFAAMLVTGGRMADQYGRKRAFLWGLAIFGGMSLVGGLSPWGWLVIAARAGQGLGAGLLWPAIIGITCGSVDEKAKGSAVGFLMSIASIGNAAGPLIGGTLVQKADWRWTLLLNVPLAIIAWLICAKTVTEQKASGTQKTDYLGILVFSVGLVGLMLALNLGPQWGWATVQTLGLLFVAVAMLAVFPEIESRVSYALLPREMATNAGLMSACLAMATTAAPWALALLYVPQYAEKFFGYDPIKAGLMVVPLMLGFGVMSIVGGRIYDRYGPKHVVSFGLVATVVSACVVAFAPIGSDPLLLGATMALLGLSLGTSIPALTTAAVSAVESSRASLASGLIFMFQLAGIALGIAIGTAVFTATSDDALRSGFEEVNMSVMQVQEATIRDVLHADKEESDLSALRVDPRAIEVTRESYIAGVQDAFLVSAGMATIGAVVAILYVGGPLRRKRPQPRS